MVSHSFFMLAALLAFIAVYVWKARPDSAINRWFAAFTLAMSCWVLGIGGLHSGALLDGWGRFTFASASAIPAAFFRFTQAYPTSSSWPPPALLYVAFLIGAALAFLSLTTSLVVYDVSMTPLGITRKSGALYPVFAFYFLACWIAALALFIVKWRRARGLARAQLQYLGIGLVISSGGAITTNLVVPLLTGHSWYSWLGPYFVLVLIALVAHAIIRHRLMNTRLIIRQGVTYLLAVAISAGVFVALVDLASVLSALGPPDLPLWTEVSLALIIALLFQPLKSWIQVSLDRYLYRQPYDYQRTIREASRTIGTLLDLQSLLNYICEIIGRTIRPEMVSVYIQDPETGCYRRMAIQRFIEANEASEPEAVPHGAPLPAFLAREKTHLLSDDLKRVTPDPETKAVLVQLSMLRGEFVQPILVERQLTGFLVIGPKLSGDPYFAEDIDVLTTLVSQAAIAIKNAQLYRQVVLVNDYIENILATMESGVVVVAADGTASLFNSAAERMTRIAAKDIKGGSVKDLPLSLAIPLETTLKDGQSRLHMETIIQDDDGHLIPVICSTSALKDRSGTILGAVAVFSDLTKLKELEGEKRRAERLASIGVLASGIAHEIKNPLVAIKTFAELLPDRFTEEEFRSEFSNVVIREIGRIDDLVARLRGLATPPTQPLTPLDIRGPIEETLALLRGQLEQAQVAIKSVYEGELPLIAGDPAQLKQLFLNLFLNALEAMESGGELSIHLVSREADGNQTLVVEISDTGTGIPEALLDNIFDPLITTKPRGSGLGLPICRGITNAHQATIRAQNNPNARGTSIVIEFPAVHEMLATSKTLQPEE